MGEKLLRKKCPTILKDSTGPEKKTISRPLLHSHVRVGQNPRKRLQGELGNLKVYTSMLKCFFERKNASPLTEYILKPRFAQQNYEADFFSRANAIKVA